MLCPDCGSKSVVYDSRAISQGVIVSRHRQCTTCSVRWATHERIVPETATLSIELSLKDAARVEKAGGLGVILGHHLNPPEPKPEPTEKDPWHVMKLLVGSQSLLSAHDDDDADP